MDFQKNNLFDPYLHSIQQQSNESPDKRPVDTSKLKIAFDWPLDSVSQGLGIPRPYHDTCNIDNVVPLLIHYQAKRHPHGDWVIRQIVISYCDADNPRQ